MSVSTQAAGTPAAKSKHLELLKRNFSDCFQTAPPERIQALARGKRDIEHWYSENPDLVVTNKASWTAQNAVDQALVQIQGARAFAEPLLREALRKKYAVTVDVNATCLRLYQAKNSLWGLPDPLGAVTTRTVSLLDAALHNFAAGETFIEKDSVYISQPDASGRFTIKPIQRNMTIKQFMALCRELDIGKQYQAHLKEVIQPVDATASQAFKAKIIAHEKAMLLTAAAMAVASGDISENAYSVVTGMLAGKKSLTLVGRVADTCDLSLLGTKLTGIVVFGPVVQQDTGDNPIVVYIPHDPDHPMKQYDSWKAFIRELSRQLREDTLSPATQMSYRQFFSQFVDQQQRGHFFAAVQARVSKITFHHNDVLDQRPAWRDSAVEQPDLQFVRTAFTENMAQHLYQRKVDKVLKDARDLAICTADADSNARKAWWDNFRKIASDLFNVALMVVTPFVPGLGEIMLAYTAYQLGSEVIEGIEDLSKHQWSDALDDLVGILDEVAQMAAIGAGFAAGKPLLNSASKFVDGLLAVKMPAGETRLWNPDLAPYEQKDLGLHSETQAEANGLNSHNGKQILRVGDKHYEVTQDAKTEKHWIAHPQRGEAYQPEVRLNGRGTYVIEIEQPRTWDDATLLRRLGPAVAERSDAQLETARKISGTAPGELRRMYVENRQPPVLLIDTLTRLKIDRDIQIFLDQMRSDDPAIYGQADSVTQLHIMTQFGMWPKNASMRVIDGVGKPIWEHTETLAPVGKKLVVQLEERQVHNGELLGTVMAALDHNGTAVILDQAPDMPVGSLQDRTQALRERIANVCEDKRRKLYDADYASREQPLQPLAQQIRDRFPEIPVQGIDNLLAQATATERKIMTDEARIPLRLQRIAEQLTLETRTARGYEGFYRDELINADTERMTLNVLRLYTDALSDVRIEVRAERFDGELICQAGAFDASVVRVLVKGKTNVYEIRDPANASLYPATDFYRAVLQALPDEQRQRLGYLTSEGPAFKQWLMAQAEPPSVRRTALEPQLAPSVRTEDLLLLRGPLLSKSPRTLAEQVADLYPHFSEKEVSAFVRSLDDSGDAALTLSRMESELEALRTQIKRWQYDNIVNWGRHSSDYIMTGGKHLSDQLLECFERRSEVLGKRHTDPRAGFALDLSTEAVDYDIERWWKQLPALGKFVDQIRVLNVDNIRLKSDGTSLLRDFRNLRQLSARNCELTRLPERIGKMHGIETLRLSENRIRLSAQDVESLRKLTRLETLRLDDNPLGAQINVELMPRLKVLTLNNTDITTWPQGLFKMHRPRGFFLDMQDNPISELPVVVPGSEQAFIVARTRLYSNSLSEANRTLYEDYRRSVGISPYLYYSELANRELSKWPVFEDRNLGDRNPGLGTYRPEAWSALAKERNSLGFFKVIEKLRESADYLAEGEARLELSDRVWRTIDAAYLDDGLREELFIMTTAPTNCGDAGAQLFNNMGVKVLAAEAHASATSPSELQTSMVSLARGAARLEEVAEIARADVRARQGNPDEVEIHLAYETGLAARLDLPWQSREMLYRQIAGVSDETMDLAYDKILADEQGDGLVNLMLDQKVWTDFMQETWPDELEGNRVVFQDKVAAIEDLRTAQALWADSAQMTEAEKERLRQRMIVLADKIPVEHALIFTGDPMSEETWGQLYLDLGQNKKNLDRRLTRDALEKAGF